MSRELDDRFPDGLIIKAPRQGAPEFIKCSLSIKVMNLLQYLQKQTTDWINLDIKVSQQGKWYAQVNDWKPEDNSNTKPAPNKQRAAQTLSAPAPDYPSDEINPDDIPF